MVLKAVVAIVVALAVVNCGPTDHHYSDGDLIPVYVDTAGSVHNPAEAYDYYTMPVCRPDHIQLLSSSLGDMLSGRRLHNSVVNLPFKTFVKRKVACKLALDQAMIQKYISAIEQDYTFTMIIDDLSVQGFFGESEGINLEFGDHSHDFVKYYLYPRTVYSVQYNGPNVIAVSVSSDADSRIELKPSMQSLDIEFSFGVEWEFTDVPFAERMDHQSELVWSEHTMNIHWLSIINSFVLVLLLTIFLAIIILRVLRNDFARYSESDDLVPLESSADESGWKQVYGDVFRFPSHPMAFCSVVGAGAHIFSCVALLCTVSLLDTFSTGTHGAVYSAAIFCYGLTAPIGGYVSGYLNAQIGGDTKWATNALVTALVFSFPLSVVFLTVNSIAFAYGSAVAIPFLPIFGLFSFWACIAFPLTVFGAMRGRKAAKPFEAPCKTNRVRREIPPLPWFQTKPSTIFISGFLPFSAIYIEMHYIFAAVWGHQIYRLFGMLAIAFIMLILVTSFITVSLTYFQLAHENYLWWWSAFFNGSAGGIFVLAYSTFYYFFRSTMSGVLQASFFFGYMLLISYAFSLMLGAIGFAASLPFVRYIYASIKSD